MQPSRVPHLHFCYRSPLTALVWIIILATLISVNHPSTSISLIWSLKPICSDCYILLGPESEVTIGKDAWLSCRQVDRNWEHCILRCSPTLRVLASVCRWSMSVILTHPVAMRRAEFWMVCSLAIELWLGVGKPNPRCVGEERADERFEGYQDGLLLLPPVGSSELFE